MAQRITKFSPATRSSKYDWSQWFDGDVWRLEQGVDFDCQMTAMQSNAIGRARARGGRVLTRTVRDMSSPDKPKRWLELQFVAE